MCLLTLLLVYFVIGYALLISLGLKYGWRDYSVKENITAFTIGAILWLKTARPRPSSSRCSGAMVSLSGAPMAMSGRSPVGCGGAALRASSMSSAPTRCALL